MSAFFFSTESQSPAAQMISDCFHQIKQGMKTESFQKYTDAISEISIIPFCVSEELMNFLQYKERKYIGWKRKEADIRLQIPFLPFVQASPDERMNMCKDVVIRSLGVVKEKCEKKKVRFDLDALLNDIFPDR